MKQVRLDCGYQITKFLKSLLAEEGVGWVDVIYSKEKGGAVIPFS